MLKKIVIVNYAVIDRIEAEFGKGLCIITGETGAGKSIIVDALELALGSRADTASIRDKEKKCIVEAVFDIQHNTHASTWLKENDLDGDIDLVLRREFSASGKSRAFINDTPVSLQQLKYVRSYLIDLHQQFDHTEITGTEYQRRIMDVIAGCEKEVFAFQHQYHIYKNLSQEINLLKQKAGHEQKERDYRQYLYDELESAAFTDSEIESAASELTLLENSEEIASVLSQFNILFQEGEEAFLPRMKSLLQKIRPFTDLNKELKELENRMREAYTELADISQDINRQEDKYQPDNSKKSRLSERIDLGYKLMKKHQVQTTAELLEIHQALQHTLAESQNPEEIIAQKSKELSALETTLFTEAEQLHSIRIKAIPPLVEKMNVLLKQVGMPNARFDILLSKTTNLSSFGTDSISFVFNANIPRGEIAEKAEMRPIGSISSGGELSRLMLCLQSFIAEKTDLPVLVFDEIDAGISGEAVRQVGLLMKQMAYRHQIIAITHMPQVAARADHHYYVFKDDQQKEIHTHLKKLSPTEHIDAIAQMISGNQITDSTIKMAKELIDRENTR